MADLNHVPNPPSIDRNEFNCPHCGAHSNQTWFNLAAESINDCGVPNFPNPEWVSSIENDREMDRALKDKLIGWAVSVETGRVFIEREQNGNYWYYTVYNLHLSTCYTCKKVAVWVHQNLIYPKKSYNTPPNSDLPADVRRDYEEASEILDMSPRGSAALLRLAIQKLCIQLGEPGKNINADIASLVKRGLDRAAYNAFVRYVRKEVVFEGFSPYSIFVFRLSESTPKTFFYASEPYRLFASAIIGNVGVIASFQDDGYIARDFAKFNVLNGLTELSVPQFGDLSAFVLALKIRMKKLPDYVVTAEKERLVFRIQPLPEDSLYSNFNPEKHMEITRTAFGFCFERLIREGASGMKEINYRSPFRYF